MKSNYVILNEIAYDDGSYETIINTQLGTFTGYTEPDEIDKQYLSIYHASDIALAKALRKFAKAAAAQSKREIKLLQGMINQAITCANLRTDVDNNSFRIMNGTLKEKKKELTKWESKIKGLTKNITNRVAARDKIVAKYVTKDKKD